MNRILLFGIILLVIECCSSETKKVFLNRVQGDEVSKIRTYKFLQEIGALVSWDDKNFLTTKSNIDERTFGHYDAVLFRSLVDSVPLIYKRDVNGYISIDFIMEGQDGFVVEEGDTSYMSPVKIGFMKYWGSLDFFKCIRHLTEADSIRVRFNDYGQMAVFDSTTDRFLYGFAFEPNNWLPKEFIRPKFNDQNISLRIEEWSEVEGIKYPSKYSNVDYTFEEKIVDVIFCSDMNTCTTML
ncbi:MAG: hypothetical protein RLN88_13640 [Ekhidna sp.]|uniref:hypothetical protein n=1 Tax=Ekhidna sp. TaxID=2608089 RepID=UPI0032F024BB